MRLADWEPWRVEHVERRRVACAPGIGAAYGEGAFLPCCAVVLGGAHDGEHDARLALGGDELHDVMGHFMRFFGEPQPQYEDFAHA